MKILAAVLLTLSFGSQGQGTHVSGADYWLAERTGRVRSNIEAEREHGVRKLGAITGVTLDEPHEWLAWHAENGDFLSWSDASIRRERRAPSSSSGLWRRTGRRGTCR